MSVSMIKSNGCIIVKGVLVKYKNSDPFVKIPDGVSCIGKEAFSYQKIQVVEIPDTVTRIDDNAFYHCEELYKINLPESITYIGRDVFSYCWKLKIIQLPKGLQHIGSGAFSNTGIQEINIPSGINEIENQVFEYCSSLKKVELSGELKTIWSRAFYHCRELTDFTSTKRIDAISGDAFQGCDALTGDNGLIIIDNKLLYYNGNERVIRIPEGVNHIANNVFEKKRRLRKVVLPESVLSIGYSAFAECENLREINVPENVEIDTSAFFHCPGLANDKGFVIINGILFGYYDDRNAGIVNEQKTEDCYQEAMNHFKNYDGSNREQLERAIDIFEIIAGYKDSEVILRSYYKQYWNLDI